MPGVGRWIGLLRSLHALLGDGVGQQPLGQVLGLAGGQHPPDGVAGVDVDDGVQVVVGPLHRPGQFRDVPRPALVRGVRDQLGFHPRRVGGLPAPFGHPAVGLAQDPVHRGGRAQVAALVEQHRVHLARGQVDEPLRVQHVEDLGPLARRQRPRLRRRLRARRGPGRGRGLAVVAVVGGPRASHRRARRPHPDQRGQLGDGGVGHVSLSFLLLPAARLSNRAESFDWTSITRRAVSSSPGQALDLPAQPGRLRHRRIRRRRPRGPAQRLQRPSVALSPPRADQRGVQAFAAQQRTLPGPVARLVLSQHIPLVLRRVRTPHRPLGNLRVRHISSHRTRLPCSPRRCHRRCRHEGRRSSPDRRGPQRMDSPNGRPMESPPAQDKVARTCSAFAIDVLVDFSCGRRQASRSFAVAGLSLGHGSADSRCWARPRSDHAVPIPSRSGCWWPGRSWRRRRNWSWCRRRRRLRRRMRSRRCGSGTGRSRASY